MNRIVMRRTLPLLACAALAFAAAAPAGAAPTAPGKATAERAVSMKNFTFAPAEITVAPGDTVVWTNNDTAEHDVQGKSGPEGFDSELFGKGKTYEFTFAEEGAYDYLCTIHANMTGKVTVSKDAPAPGPLDGLLGQLPPAG